MASGTDDAIPGVDLSDDEYVIRQHLLRRKFKVFDTSGDLVMRARKKYFKMKEEFPFVDADDNPLFTVKAGQILDHAGDYTLTTEDGRKIAILDKKFTLFLHKWKIRDPHTEQVLAVVESEGSLTEMLRSLSGLFALLPHTYTIESPRGAQLGELRGKFSLRDEYTLRIFDSRGIPREALIACAIAIDMLEGN